MKKTPFWLRAAFGFVTVIEILLVVAVHFAHEQHAFWAFILAYLAVMIAYTEGVMRGYFEREIEGMNPK